jgi:hypothetical protein
MVRRLTDRLTLHGLEEDLVHPEELLYAALLCTAEQLVPCRFIVVDHCRTDQVLLCTSTLRSKQESRSARWE